MKTDIQCQEKDLSGLISCLRVLLTSYAQGSVGEQSKCIVIPTQHRLPNSMFQGLESNVLLFYVGFVGVSSVCQTAF